MRYLISAIVAIAGVGMLTANTANNLAADAPQALFGLREKTFNEHNHRHLECHRLHRLQARQPIETESKFASFLAFNSRNFRSFLTPTRARAREASEKSIGPT